MRTGYTRLRNAPVRRDVVISRGTHVMHVEESRFQLYREVHTFLDGRDRAPTLSTVELRARWRAATELMSWNSSSTRYGQRSLYERNRPRQPIVQ